MCVRGSSLSEEDAGLVDEPTAGRTEVVLDVLRETVDPRRRAGDLGRGSERDEGRAHR